MGHAYDCYIAYVSPCFDRVEPLGRDDVAFVTTEQKGRSATTKDPFA